MGTTKMFCPASGSGWGNNAFAWLVARRVRAAAFQPAWNPSSHDWRLTPWKPSIVDGADGGGRTHTSSRIPDFESGASANSATSATNKINTFCGIPKSTCAKDGKWRPFPKVPQLLPYVTSGNCFGKGKINGHTAAKFGGNTGGNHPTQPERCSSNAPGARALRRAPIRPTRVRLAC